MRIKELLKLFYNRSKINAALKWEYKNILNSSYNRVKDRAVSFPKTKIQGEILLLPLTVMATVNTAEYCNITEQCSQFLSDNKYESSK